MPERLQKFLANAGVASRRAAEKLITAGKVKVNGQVVTKLGTKIDPARDEISVNGKKVKPISDYIYIALNKPKRFMTTRHDPQKRRTIYELLPPDLRTKVWPVGRLDFQTEGLLLLTNDGDLTQSLTHPSAEHEKEYEVVLDREPTEAKLGKIETGVFLDGPASTRRQGEAGKKTAPAKARSSGKVVYLTIHEGWKRQIRRMFSALGYTVRNLKRIRIGKLKLGDLKAGEYRYLEKNQIL